jgi:hypothetical protein
VAPLPANQCAPELWLPVLFLSALPACHELGAVDDVLIVEVRDAPTELYELGTGRIITKIVPDRRELTSGQQLRQHGGNGPSQPLAGERLARLTRLLEHGV